MAAALTLIRSLWPQTSTWEPAVWQAWAQALGDLEAEALLVGIRRASAVEAWPSIAVIRRGALAAGLAPPAAVALTDRSHPVAREVERLTAVDQWLAHANGRVTIDEGRFMRVYRELAAEWNAAHLAGETMALPGNRGADAVHGAYDASKAVRSGADPFAVVSALTDDALDQLVEGEWSFVFGSTNPYVLWTAEGDRQVPEWVAAAEAAVAAEGERRGRPWAGRLALENPA